MRGGALEGDATDSETANYNDGTGRMTHGAMTWRRNGKLHREGDKPAVVHPPGSRYADGYEWHRDGKLHRDGDKPAIQSSTMNAWYRDNVPHRDGDHPAVVHANGTRSWFKHGKLHREDDKPAIVHGNGEQEWWVDGVNEPAASVRKRVRCRGADCLSVLDVDAKRRKAPRLVPDVSRHIAENWLI